MEAIALIGIGTSLIGGGMSAYGQYQEGRSAKAAYDYNASVSEANAAAIRQKTELEEVQSREKLKRLLGQQRALYGKGGVDITSGSPLLIMAETAAEGEREALGIRYTGDVEATQQLNQARLNRYYGKSAYRAGRMGAVSSFFTGLGQAGMDFYKLRKA